MKKEYIRIEEMKELFPEVPTLKSMKTSLKAELERIANYDNQYDIIDSVNFGHELSGEPRSNNISDKTSAAAMAICSKNDEEKKAILKAISSEIYLIDTVLEKIEIALKGLSEPHKQLLELKYWENKTWLESMYHMQRDNKFYSIKQLQKMNRDAIKKVTVISMITIEMYERIKKLINI